MPDKADSEELARLNWGALTLTPFWLVRNGFLVSFVSYVALALFAWPMSLLVSVLFFVKGTEWSWGGGRRWKNREEFDDSQYLWGYVGKVAVLPVVVVVLWAAYRVVVG